MGCSSSREEFLFFWVSVCTMYLFVLHWAEYEGHLFFSSSVIFGPYLMWLVNHWVLYKSEERSLFFFNVSKIQSRNWTVPIPESELESELTCFVIDDWWNWIEINPFYEVLWVANSKSKLESNYMRTISAIGIEDAGILLFLIQRHPAETSVSDGHTGKNDANTMCLC